MTAYTATSAAAHALVGVANGFDEIYLRAWFTETLGGTEVPITGGYRLEAFAIACPSRGRFREALGDWAAFVIATRGADPLRAFLEFLDRRESFERTALIEAAVISTGGTWVPAQIPGSWGGSHLFEISLFHVLGRGSDASDAAQDWHKAATRVARPEAA